MPIYLCKPGPGWNPDDPRRHSIPVYAHPFHLQDADYLEQYHRHAALLNSRMSSESRSGADAADRATFQESGANGAMEDPSQQRGNVELDGNENNDNEEREGFNNMNEAVRVGPFAQFDPAARNSYPQLRYEMTRLAQEHGQRDRVNIVRNNNPYNDEGPNGNRRNSIHQHEREGGIGLPIIRRLRYAEVILVDAVFYQYETCWLRLKWPGPRGGDAGYIALPADVSPGKFDRCYPVTGDNEVELDIDDHGQEGDDETRMEDAVTHHDENALHPERSPPEGCDHIVEDDDCLLLEQKITEGSDGASVNTVQSHTVVNLVGEVVSIYPPPPRCEATGYYFPTCKEVELLDAYDDGLAAMMTASDADSFEGDNACGEKVICRICREGLHDIDYDCSLQDGEEAAKKDDIGNGVAGNLEIRHNAVNDLVPRGIDQGQMPAQGLPQRQQRPHVYVPNSPNTAIATSRQHPYSQNPLLSPCDCSGSMAFVHYLCIEQWRCRSRHPAARSGSHCETCRTPYTLPPRPPPPVQPHRDLRAGGDPDDPNNDLLEGMPPHVLHALRNPHLGWRVGSSLVRRRWLRPVAPILISPVVALYCRARRALKKRGVSRRRWACSLCRRRARWKCVRCLRSYYCSRQCQNVSWHIVHKHVCYKPARLGYSMVVYGGLILWLIPGISQYPLLYDLGLSFLWLSFGCMGILGGGVATAFKKGLGLDIRGRTLEGVVVGSTIAFATMLWYLIWGFFVPDAECLGVAELIGFGQSFTGIEDLPQSISPSFWHVPHFGAKQSISPDEPNLGIILTVVQNLILYPGQKLVKLLDKILLQLDPRVTRWLCTNSSDSFCLKISNDANPNFIVPSTSEGMQCNSDMHLGAWVFLLAGFFLAFGFFWRRREWVLGRGRQLRMRGGGRRRRLGRRDNAAEGIVMEFGADEREDVRRRHAHQD